jgi:hypothetical protein
MSVNQHLKKWMILHAVLLVMTQIVFRKFILFK